jgi:hypothetical protein
MREKLERGESGCARAESVKNKGYFHHLDKITTSFFFTNIPNEATSEDLWKLFLKYGRVGEVFLPKKLDKRGRRFGFVKFKEVMEVDELSDKLRDVWLGSFKLWVNRSRFGRMDRKEAPVNNTSAQTTEKKLEGVANVNSFRNVLMGGGNPRRLVPLKVPVNELLSKELQGSMVGVLACEKEVNRIQTTLFMEGFQSIKVTDMGGNMALLRSTVEGDMQRLLRSNNECLPYYFSKLKPWNPGLIATQREVWIQIYGIPIHIWGDNFFKMIGNRFGVFVDYDEETASMARFDVARVKILTTTWASIDENVKVEVEGVCFDLWVVEEKGLKRRSGVVFHRELEDEGSVAVPVAGTMEVNDVTDGDDENSGEDDESGEDIDGDVRRNMQGVGFKTDNNDISSTVQETKDGEIFLTCEKSKEIPNFEEEIPCVGFKESVRVAEEKEQDLAVSTNSDVRGKGVEGGAKGFEHAVSEDSTCGGPPPGFENLINSVGLAGQGENPILVGQVEVERVAPDEVERVAPDPLDLGLIGEEVSGRYSSISEPEEILSSGRVTFPKKMVKNRKQKQIVKPSKLGVPKCIQFVESVKEIGPKSRRRKQRSKGLERNTEVIESDGDTPSVEAATFMEHREGEGCSRWSRGGTVQRNQRVSPQSGINLLSESENSSKSTPPFLNQADEREKVIQAAKLLNIQKGVGFTFVETDVVTINQLVENEKSDRVKKMEWEQRECDQ